MTVQNVVPADRRLFSGSADYYARYRPAYPEGLIAHLTAHAPPGPAPRRVLDLGCGTGQLAIPLSYQFDEVTAVDVAEDMVARGRAQAQAAGRDRIGWVVSEAEAYTAPPGQFCLVTAGASFHWMDRHTVGARVLRWLRPGGVFAVAGANSTWNGNEDWQKLVIEVIKRWLGPMRRAGSGTFDVGRERHEDVLRAVGFVAVTDTLFEVRHTWEIDSFIGYLYSTSFAAKSVLGDRAPAFEADMRRTLLGFDATGSYTETLRFHVMTGTAPR